MAERIPQAVIDQLLGSTDIVDLIDGYVPLKKMGANYKACCPFHEENSPSFVVSPQKQIFHCFGCGVGGNVLSFLMSYDNLSFFEALELLAKRVGLTLPKQNFNKSQSAQKLKTSEDLHQTTLLASQFYQSQLREHPLAKKAKEYLIQRGLSGEIAQKFQIGFAPAGWDNLIKHLATKCSLNSLKEAGLITQKNPQSNYDRFRDRIMFPIRNRQGKTIAFGGRVIDEGEPKYLNSPETPIFHKSNELYGLYELLQSVRQPDYIIIVEGYMDVVALAQHGINQVVGTLGTATTAQHMQLLLRYTNKIIFCFDGDNAGKKAAERALETALPLISPEKTLRFMFLASGEDPDSFVREQGKQVFIKQLDSAQSLSEFFVQHITSSIDISLADDKAKLISLSINYLKQVSNSQLQQVLAQEMANKARLPYQQFQQMLDSATTNHSDDYRDSRDSRDSRGSREIKNNRNNNYSQPQTALNQNTVSALQKTIAIALQYPEHASQLDLSNFTLPTHTTGHKLLTQLLEMIQHNPKITTAMLLENWRDQPEFKHLMKLSGLPLLIDGDGLQKELADSLTKISQENTEQRIEELMTKAKKKQMSQDERQELSDLLKHCANEGTI